jgi:hypothetical protein
MGKTREMEEMIVILLSSTHLTFPCKTPWTATVVDAYDADKRSAPWLSRVVNTSIFFGVINTAALTWDKSVQAIIIRNDLLMYSAFLALTITVLRKTSLRSRYLYQYFSIF